MELPFDIKYIIFDYLYDTKDKINYCYLNKENNNKLKIKKLLYPSTRFTESFLKQKIFSELVELDISNNEYISSVNYLNNLKKLICRGQNSRLSQQGIKDLKLYELYCEGNIHIYDVGHMKDTLVHFESNDNIKESIYNEIFCFCDRLGIYCMSIMFLILSIIFASIWFGIYFGLISEEVYKKTQYIETVVKVNNITITPFICCNLICDTCTMCNSTNIPSCMVLIANDTSGYCCNGYKCCKTCYKTCCRTRTSRNGRHKKKICYSCNPYCCSSIEDSKCYNNCGTCYLINVYSYYNTNNNKTVNMTNKYDCGMNDIECLKNINNSISPNYTIYYDRNNIFANTRSIEYTPGKFVGLGIVSICLITINMILIILCIKYVQMSYKYEKFIRARKGMENILLI